MPIRARESLCGIATFLFALVAMTPTASADKLLYSMTFHGEGACIGTEQLLVLEGPWLDDPIMVRGVAVAHRISHRGWLALLAKFTPGYAFSGSSAPDGDILSPTVIGDGAAALMYPPGVGFLFPPRGTVDPRHVHIDVHAACAWPDKRHEVWLTIFYTIGAPTS